MLTNYVSRLQAIFVCGTKAGNLVHLARSGSQLEHRTPFILPARGASNIVNENINATLKNVLSTFDFIINNTNEKWRSRVRECVHRN